MTTIESRSPYNATNQNIGKVIGMSLLIMFVLGIFAEFIVRTQLIDFTNPSETMEKIKRSLPLFRAGIIAFLIILVLDVILSAGFYRITKSINAFAALLTIGLRIVYVSIKGFAIAGLILASDIYASSTAPVADIAMYFLKAHHYGFAVALFFFGIHLIVLAWLLKRSAAIPSIIVWLLYIGGVGYSLNSVATFVISDQDMTRMAIMTVFILPMTFSEIALGLWLWTKGNSLRKN